MGKSKVFLVSLGCAKNTVDSERVLGLLKERCSLTSDPSEAELILVNTCGFITPAKEESIETILELSEYKKKGAKLVVFGCLAKRYEKELKEELHEADLILPTEPFKEIKTFFKIPLEGEKDRVLLTPRSYAYLKIAEGCNRTCAFCAIPQIRGKFRSKPIEELVDEAKRLIEAYGIKELVIVSQDTVYYGKDLYGKFALPQLLDELQKLSIRWIRIHYLYPSAEVYKLTEYLERYSQKVLPYIDMPIQHIADSVLKPMRRGHTGSFLKKLLYYIRERLGDNSILRTTVIVGFPTEGEREFGELLKFVQDFGFDYLGVFPYYHEEDTPAWKNLKDTVPWEEKLKRKELLEELQSGFSEKRLSRFLNTESEVLVEGYDEEVGLVPVGRTWFQAPEVDGITYLQLNKGLKLEEGQFVKAYLSKQIGVDFKGEVF